MKVFSDTAGTATNQWVPHISPVIGEMWEERVLTPSLPITVVIAKKPDVESRISHISQQERWEI